MGKLQLFLLVVIFCPLTLPAQDDSTNNNDLQQTLFYKKIYTYADSINKTAHYGTLDKTVFRTAASCDSLHPLAYYEKVMDEMQHSHFNEAAFLYFLANLRYGYYNAANPDYKASEDGALAGSFNYIAGEPIKMYLQTNVNNFVAILKKSVAWCLKNDYIFYSKNKDLVKYKAGTDGLNSMIADMEKNRLKYQTDWTKEREKMEKDIDTYIGEMKKNKSK